MAASKQCYFDKYGHCKFGVQCKLYHATELCLENNCDIQNCHKRHPRACKFFNSYRRCKFNESCSFSHSVNSLQCSVTSMVSRLDAVEELVKKKEDEIVLIRKENQLLEAKMSQMIVDVSRNIIEETIKTLVNTLIQRQDEMEKLNSRQFDAIEKNLQVLSKLFQSSTIAPALKSTPKNSTPNTAIPPSLCQRKISTVNEPSNQAKIT